MRSFARIIFTAGILYYVDATFYSGIHIQAGLAVAKNVANAIMAGLLQLN
jgi:hypothetical protein